MSKFFVGFVAPPPLEAFYYQGRERLQREGIKLKKRRGVPPITLVSPFLVLKPDHQLLIDYLKDFERPRVLKSLEVEVQPIRVHEHGFVQIPVGDEVSIKPLFNAVCRRLINFGLSEKALRTRPPALTIGIVRPRDWRAARTILRSIEPPPTVRLDSLILYERTEGTSLNVARYTMALA